MITVLSCLTQQHDLGLVALSAGICLLGCFTAATLMAQAETARGPALMRWIWAAATIFGGSIWALHFVAMLAFLPDARIAYALDATASSVAVAVAGTLLALLVWRDAEGRPVGVAVSGALLGFTIAGMHYVGVAAMQPSGLIFLDHGHVLASVAVSLGFAGLALLRARDLLRPARRLEVTAWLTLAICGLHFTGMTAVTIVPVEIPPETSGIVLGSTQLALAVGIVSIAILAASLAAMLVQQHLSLRAVQELARMRLLSDLAHEVLLIHHDGSVAEINSAGLRLIGRPVEEIVGRPVFDLFAEEDGAVLVRRASARGGEALSEEVRIRTAGGDLVPVELSCRAIEYRGRPATAVALRDLTERRRDEARIRHLALHDTLTDLPNRYLLEQRLGHALQAAAHEGAQEGARVGVVYLDLDRFKPVNDLHGHAAGDALLVQAARRMAAELRPADTLARVGGDEFVAVLAGGPSPAQVSEITGRLLACLRRPFRIEDHRLEIGASAGIALYPSDGTEPETLLRAADTALYRAKDEGRGTLRFFEASMDAQIQARRQLEQELRRAIEDDELRLHYQPIVDGRSGEIGGFEALIRWHHPERGLVPPVAFIPLAEQSDLIARIGAWVVDEACAAAASWPEPWRVAVNVSPSQFRLCDLPALVSAALDRHQLDPGRLVVEITESVFIQDADQAVDVLTCLRARGVRLALDDFGTGYSSLSYLQRFRFDEIKVDRSFVGGLGQHADALTLCRAIVNLGHNLGLQVTLEGVETLEQLAILAALGCDRMQGYLFARPGPEIAVAAPDRARLRALFSDLPVRLRA